MTIGLNICAEAKTSTPEYITYIDGVSETYNISPYLVQSIIFYESSWCTGVISEQGCIGLMQINPVCHKDRMKRLGCTNLGNGYQNIMVGCDYLAELIDEYQDVAMALDAYNGNIHSYEWYEQGNMTNYTKKVLELAETLEGSAEE